MGVSLQYLTVHFWNNNYNVNENYIVHACLLHACGVCLPIGKWTIPHTY